MDTLSAVIKFVAGQGGGGDVPGGGTSADAVSAASSSAATGDIGFMVLAAIVLLVGACAVGAVLYQRKREANSVGSGAHIGNFSQGLNNIL